jgi:hypothetical protein
MRKLLFLGLAPLALSAQLVTAHYGQYLVDAEMTAHPELQKMGIHVVAPGEHDESIVACSVPSKIGKKSSAADLEEEKSGKTFIKPVPDRQFYDMALLLADSQGRHIGAVVMELKYSGAASPEAAIQKAEAIRDEMQTRIASLKALFEPAPAGAPLELLRTTPLPDITGDFDHFAIDRKRNRLYVSAEVHHSIEVFDLKTGEHLKSVSGVTTPHTIAFVAEKDLLLVADGGDASCRVLDVNDWHEVKRIPLEPGPDAGVYDPEQHLFYVGNGGRTAKTDFSYISILSADDLREVTKIKVPATNLESMAIDKAAHRMYVNLRDKNQIGVIDLKTNELSAAWTIEGLSLNTPMAFDAKHHRLFVAGRKPGKFFAIDTRTGKSVATLDCVETADDMTFDAATGRVYITGAGGVTVIHQESADTYRVMTQFGTNAGKTSIYDPELKQFYIAHTKTTEDNAALQVYAVR